MCFWGVPHVSSGEGVFQRLVTFLNCSVLLRCFLWWFFDFGLKVIS